LESFLPTCGTPKNSLDSFSNQRQKKTTQNLGSFFQLVEQQKLLWVFCHGSTTQAIKNLGSFFQLVEQQKLLWTFSLGTTAQAIRKFGKLFPTCGTTKTSLSIFSQINSRNNTKCGRLFNNLWNNTKFSG
jgi:hypothetical protein